MTKIKKNSSIPIYKQLANSLREQVINGNFKAGIQLPSENELSRKYSISRMTARAALLQLEKDGLVSTIHGKGRLVLDKINTYKFSPQEYFSSFTIGVYPFQEVYQSGSYFSRLLNGLTQGFLHHHVRSKFFTQQEIKNPLASFFFQKRINGLIWLGLHKKEFPKQLIELNQNGLPVVALNRTFPGSRIDYVTCDHYSGAYQLVEYLINMGHKNIAIITIPRNIEFISQRWKGYVDAHRKHHLSVNPKLIIEVENIWEGGKNIPRKLHALRKKKDWPTAIFIALGGLQQFIFEYLNNEKIKIPEHISVVVFDEVYLPPPLPKFTCVRQPLEEMGEVAVDILMRNLHGKKTHPAEVIIKPAFISGNSCMPSFRIKER